MGIRYVCCTESRNINMRAARGEATKIERPATTVEDGGGRKWGDNADEYFSSSHIFGI